MLVRKQGEDKWRQPAATAYQDEQTLQNMGKNSPELLPGISDNSIAVVTEMTAQATGSIDIVGVDAICSITLVECTLRASSEIRRQITRQTLAFAASLWGISYEEIDRILGNRHDAAGAIMAWQFSSPFP